jgi:phage baseplate assembly protein W
MDEELYGSDIKLQLSISPDFYGIGADIAVSRRGDVGTVTGRDNLGQAIMHRLLTRVGELEELGYPDYGSRLHELIGRPNNAETRRLVKLYARECLAQESRIEKVEGIQALALPDSPHVVLLEIAVIPADSLEPMGISMPVSLEVGE